MSLPETTFRLRGGRSADQDVGRHAQRLDSLFLSRDRIASARVGADEVALHEVIRAAPTRPSSLPVDDAVEGVPRDEIPGGRRRAADRHVGRPGVQKDSDEGVAEPRGARRIGADEVALDHDAVGSFNQDAGACRPVEDQPADGASVRGRREVQDRIHGFFARIRSVDLDHELRVGSELGPVRVRGRPGLGVPVDRDGAGDQREGRSRDDRMGARADDVELDGVGPAGRVGVGDGLPEGAGPGIVHIGDREGRGARDARDRAKEARDEETEPKREKRIGTPFRRIFGTARVYPYPDPAPKPLRREAGGRPVRFFIPHTRISTGNGVTPGAARPNYCRANVFTMNTAI